MTRRSVKNNILQITDENGSPLFSIEETISGDTLKMALSGKIQNNTAYEFEDEVMAALSVCKNSVCSNPICNRIKCTQYIFNLSNVTYISSMALHSFLEFQNVIDGFEKSSMIILNPSEAVMERLTETGYIDLLDIREE